MSVVELQTLSKRYGDITAVDAIDLVVEAGEFVTLLGPSGCGKTTTLRMIAGFVRPSGGRISIGENDVTSTPPHLRLVGFVFQNYALFPHMTVAQNIEFGLRMHKVPAAERRQRVNDALELVRLEPLAGRYPRQLSGGQQQRVALARALVIRPAVLLLDEPFGALDKQLRDHMRVELRALQQQLGISTVFVTHDQEEALAMSDRICVMADGVIQQVGAPGMIYEKPCNRFVAEFMGRSNLLTATIIASENDQQIIDAAGLRLRARQRGFGKDRAAVAMIRPERIRLQRAGSDTAALSGIVTGSVYLGAIRHYEVALGNGSGNDLKLQVMRQNADAADELAPGSPVDVIIPDDAVYLISES